MELRPSTVPAAANRGTHVLGIPVGDFGLFATLLLSVALGFITFFGVTFFSIFAILIYNSVANHSINLSYSYKYIALPAGLLVLLVATLVLGGVWLKRTLTGR